MFQMMTKTAGIYPTQMFSGADPQFAGPNGDETSGLLRTVPKHKAGLLMTMMRHWEQSSLCGYSGTVWSAVTWLHVQLQNVRACTRNPPW